MALTRGMLLAAATASCAGAGPPRDAAAADFDLVVRVVRPERQASAVLELFAGARAPHPAAALASWKRATGNSGQLGKTLEAVIAVFNPEMPSEWRVLDRAELRLDPSGSARNRRWFAIVPSDDGTLSAAITAMRLTSGSRQDPLTGTGAPIPVERLGSAGTALAAQVGDALVLASAREELARGVRTIAADREAIHATKPGEFEPSVPVIRLQSGIVFDLNAEAMNAGAGNLAARRALALLRGLDCRQLHGELGLAGERIACEINTTRGPRDLSKIAISGRPAAVDPSWLTHVPIEGLVGVISVAFEIGSPFWDSVFNLADQVERADPARGDPAPLRARLNLLAATAGARPEVDLWPHMRGVTASVFADNDQPGRAAGFLVILHTDADASALRLATDVVPRLGSIFLPRQRAAEPTARLKASDASPLGSLAGRSLSVSRNGRDVLIAWGDHLLAASKTAAARPERSVASLCTGWAPAAKGTPQRVGAAWPARLWPLVTGANQTTPAQRALAQGPPAVWWGWNESSGAVDCIECTNLRALVHDFLEKLPLDVPPLR